MSRTLGGRSLVARPVTREFAPPRGPAIPTTAVCLGESFDEPDSDIVGPDLDWDQYGRVNGRDIGGLDSTRAGTSGYAGHVKDDRCSLFAPSDPPGGNADNKWLAAAFEGRTVDAVGSDVAVTTDMHHVGGGPFVVGDMNSGWCAVYARMETETLEPAFPFPSGWWVRARRPEALEGDVDVVWTIQLGWDTPAYSGSMNGMGTVFSTNGLPPDNVGLTVIGEGMDLVVSSNADGVAVESYTMADILVDFPDALDDAAFLPHGERAGFQLEGGVASSVSEDLLITYGSYNVYNDDVWVDNWQVCPA